MINTLVDSRYRITSEIGQGGMGRVYKAEHTYTRRKIALKVIHPEFQREPAYRDRFLREIELACRVQHPHAVQILDAGKAEGDLLYMAMEFLDGQTLSKVLEGQSSGLDVQTTMHLVRQIGQALDAIHAEGLVHRDLKPDNIMILMGGTDTLDQSQVKILDFGIARHLNTLHSLTGSRVIGTPEFMSPEQTRGEKLDKKSDIYNLGLIAYSMLTGQGPFSSDTPIGYVYHHNTSPPPSLSTKNKDLPEGIDLTIQKALAKKPEARFETASKFIASLEQAMLPGKIQPPAMNTAPATRQFTPTLIYHPPVKPESRTHRGVKNDSSKMLKYYGICSAVCLVLVVLFLQMQMIPAARERSTHKNVRPAALTEKAEQPIEALEAPRSEDSLVTRSPITTSDQSSKGPSIIEEPKHQTPALRPLNKTSEPPDIEHEAIQEDEMIPLLFGLAGAERDTLSSRGTEVPEEQYVSSAYEEALVNSVSVADESLNTQQNDFRVDEEDIYIIPDELARVKGGMGKLRSQIRYPAMAMRANVSGVVAVRLMIDEQGKMKMFSVLQSVGFGCEEEVKRVLQNARFVPGKVENEPVKSWVTLHFKFQLD